MRKSEEAGEPLFFQIKQETKFVEAVELCDLYILLSGICGV